MNGNPKQRLTLTDLKEPQQIRELNRQLSWIWDRLLGGLGMKAFDSGTRQTIEDKASRSEVTQTASEIRAEVSNEVKGLNTTISQTASEIRAEVADEIKGVNSTISQTASEIRSKVDDEVAGLNSTISQTAGAIRTEVSNTAAGLQSQINQTPEKIELAVENVRVGGTQLLAHSKRLKYSDTSDTWGASANAWFYDYADDGFKRGEISMSNLTADGWRWITSPIIPLPTDWQGRQVTVSAYIYSPDWSAVDMGATCSLSLSKDNKNRQKYANWPLVSGGAKPAYGSEVRAERTLANNKWLRVSMTFTLDEATLSSGTGTFTDNTHMFVTFWLRRNGDFRFYAPKLEWGNKATDWSPHPEEFEAGTNVLITKDQFKVKTPEFSVDIPTEDGTETMLRIDKEGVYTPQLESPNVAQRYDGPGTLYVNPNATSAQIAAGNYFRALKDVLSVLSYKALTYAVTVNIAAGHEESGTLTLRGVYGGQTITINGNSSNHMKLYGRLNIWYCAGPVLVRNVDVIATGVGIEVSGSPTFSDIYGCVLTGPGISVSGAHGIHSNNGAMAYVGAVEIYDFYRSMYAMNGGVVAASDCKGNCNVAAQRSTIYMTGGMPCASTTWGASVWGGQAITGGVTVDQGSKPSAPAVTTKTVSYKANNSDVYAGGGWNNYSAEDIYQGYTTALGEHRGCFWFDNATIRSALNGKTIKQATLTLYQMSGVGRNQPVQVNLEGITATSGTGNSPVGKPEYGVIGTTLGVNQATTFTLPTAVITDLVKGTINGLMLRTGETSVMKNDDNSYHYARFAGKATAANAPVLTVVYA